MVEKHAREEDTTISSLLRSISPPAKRVRQGKCIPSPWSLTWIRDIPERYNENAVTLMDLLGDPLISECWVFNYLHDVDFIMEALDPDTRHLVKLNIVHGFWKKETPNRLNLEVSISSAFDVARWGLTVGKEQASQYDNVTLHTAPMPEMFGTHHSKMMIQFRYDDTAEVIIHTANMIAKDWTNMTNGVWRTPRLPKAQSNSDEQASIKSSELPFGCGNRFKLDLLRYLRCYNVRTPTCASLIKQLASFDFSAVKGALIASVPGRHYIEDDENIWGWRALEHATNQIKCEEGKSQIAIQISSIATLGPKDDWLRKVLFKSLVGSSQKECSYQVVFPTADEIRRSLDGYDSGASIHTKTQSKQQTSQLQYLKPILYHWANDSSKGKALPPQTEISTNGRDRAAPHVKTYIRYNSKNTLDWALLTSANLSKQAWGEPVNSGGEVRVASWEIGVMVWPDLFEEGAKMKGIFASSSNDTTESSENSSTVSLSIPYSLPLQGYGASEVPWVATISHLEPDNKGEIWRVAD